MPAYSNCPLLDDINTRVCVSAPGLCYQGLDLPPQITGPAKHRTEVVDHSIPSRIPNSLVGLIAPQLAATNAIQAPLKAPYATNPTTAVAVLIDCGTQKTYTEMELPRMEMTKIVQTPKRSARMPDKARPIIDPACNIAIE